MVGREFLSPQRLLNGSARGQPAYQRVLRGFPLPGWLFRGYLTPQRFLRKSDGFSVPSLDSKVVSCSPKGSSGLILLSREFWGAVRGYPSPQTIMMGWPAARGFWGHLIPSEGSINLQKSSRSPESSQEVSVLSEDSQGVYPCQRVPRDNHTAYPQWSMRGYPACQSVLRGFSSSQMVL